MLKPSPILRRNNKKVPRACCSLCKTFSTSSHPKNVLRRTTSQKLPTTPARTRFAPSPTGYLHLGSLRTALFNFLLARVTGGQFILRIEDTDRKRTVPGAEERICRDLEWAGLHWDEGPEVGGPYGSYRQSERSSIYTEHAQKLMTSGNAYRCFCSSDRLNTLAKHRSQLGLPTDYDRNCSSISNEESDHRALQGESYIIRLRVPEIYPIFNDLVYGPVGRQNQKGPLLKYGEPAYEDPVLIKSDGMPTYHLANVVDDHLMKITHVIRAVEWMPSTTNHLVLYNAFNWEPPAFAHVGLLQNDNRQKLSKRNSDLDIQSFKQDSIFPEALVNHVALLGWSHTLSTDFLPLSDLIKNFDLKFTKGNTVTSFGKLSYLQKQYAQRYIEERGKQFEDMIEELFSIAISSESDSDVLITREGPVLRKSMAGVLRADAKQYKSPEAFLKRNWYFFFHLASPLKDINDEHVSSLNVTDVIKDEIVALSVDRLAEIPADQWVADRLKEELTAIVNTIIGTEYEVPTPEAIDGLKDQRTVNGMLHRWLRKALVGGSAGPSIPDTMALLQQDISLRRMQAAVAHAKWLRSKLDTRHDLSG